MCAVARQGVEVEGQIGLFLHVGAALVGQQRQL